MLYIYIKDTSSENDIVINYVTNHYTYNTKIIHNNEAVSLYITLCARERNDCTIRL